MIFNFLLISYVRLNVSLSKMDKVIDETFALLHAVIEKNNISRYTCNKGNAVKSKGQHIFLTYL